MHPLAARRCTGAHLDDARRSRVVLRGKSSLRVKAAASGLGRVGSGAMESATWEDGAIHYSFSEFLSETTPESQQQSQPEEKGDCTDTGGPSPLVNADNLEQKQVISRSAEPELWDQSMPEDEGGPLLPFNVSESPILPLNLDLPSPQPHAREGALLLPHLEDQRAPAVSSRTTAATLKSQTATSVDRVL